MPEAYRVTDESFFAFESNLESNPPSDSISNFRIESAVYTTQAVTPSNELQGADDSCLHFTANI